MTTIYLIRHSKPMKVNNTFNILINKGIMLEITINSIR